MSIPNIDLSEFSNTLINSCNINSMEQIFSTNGLLKNLEKALIECLLKCELTAHLGYEKNESAKDGNYRNGTGVKTIKTTHGPLELEIPRDRNATFEPQIVAKHQRNTKQIEDAVIHLYSQGLSLDQITESIKTLYNSDISESTVSMMTDAVLEEFKTRKNKPLDKVYWDWT